MRRPRSAHEGTIRLDVRGVSIAYDAVRKTLSAGKVSAPLTARDGLIRLHILVDRGSVEVFGDEGRVAISLGVPMRDHGRSLALTTTGVKVRSLEVHELKSAWK